MKRSVDVQIPGSMVAADVYGQYLWVWVQKRPDYCDRGRYVASVDFKPGTDPMLRMHVGLDEYDAWPRYYMDFDRAIAEIVEWVEDRESRIELIPTDTSKH